VPLTATIDKGSSGDDCDKLQLTRSSAEDSGDDDNGASSSGSSDQDVELTITHNFGGMKLHGALQLKLEEANPSWVATDALMQLALALASPEQRTVMRAEVVKQARVLRGGTSLVGLSNYIYMYVCMYVCMFVCMYVCMYALYTYNLRMLHDYNGSFRYKPSVVRFHVIGFPKLCYLRRTVNISESYCILLSVFLCFYVLLSGFYCRSLARSTKVVAT
jgi:hypothetical protein